MSESCESAIRNNRPSYQLDSVTIRFAGDSGDGMQLAGDRFAQESARLGNVLATLPDFPAEIRAPAGTVAGVSAFQIRVGSREVFTPGDVFDVLIAMNPAALKANLGDLKQNGIIICNRDNFTPQNLELAGLKTNPLEDESLKTKYNLFDIPISSLTREALKGSNLQPSSMERCANFFAFGVVCWLFSRGVDETLHWIDKKFAKKPEIAAANKAALNAGVAYAEASEAFSSRYEIPSARLSPGLYRNITGHQGVVYGLLAASELSKRPLFFSGYPITPASEILQELSGLLNFGVKVLQAEDEIAACSAAIGAAFAGNLAVTATSGPGMSLKEEALGLAVMAELPLVVINVQRAGPSTGMPTKPEQADLLQALFGRHGECPLVVMAISRPGDAFEVTLEACRIALERMTPVVVLSDGYVGMGSEPWLIPEITKLRPIEPPFAPAGGPYHPYQRDPQTLARFWAVPGTKGQEHRIGGLEKRAVTGEVSYDPANHQEMVEMRAAKIARVAEHFSPTKVYGKESGELLVLSWGGTFGAVRGAVLAAQEIGYAVAHVHLRYIHPLPPDLGAIIKRYRKLLIPELNLGQLRFCLRAQYLVDAEGLSKVQGQPFKITEVLAKIKQMLEC